jgi:hypothetical protein
MARKVQVILTDDLTNEAADDVETYTFGLDGTTYEIDLTGKNGEAMRDAFTRYVQAARKVSASKARQSNNGRSASSTPASNGASRSTDDRERTKAIRDWANANGHSVSERGRIPNAIVTAYEDANA